MPDSITSHTDLGSTPTALGPLAIAVPMDLRRVNPIAAVGVGAVKTVVCGVLFVLAIPLLLKLQVEMRLDMAQGYALVAAARGHLFWVLERHLERSDNTIPAHVVTALEWICLVWFEVAHANDALDTAGC